MTQRYPNPVVPAKRTAAFYACYFGVLGVVLPFLGPFLQSRGVDPVGVGLITAAFSLAKLIYTPVLGLLVDRGRWFRGVLFVHLGLSVIFSCAAAWLSQVWALGAAFFLVGTGYGTVLPLVEAAVLEGLPRGGYGALRMWGSAGFVGIAVASSQVLDRGRMGLFPWFVAALLAALALACLPFERVARPQRKSARAPLPVPILCLLLLLTLHQVSHGPYYAFFSIHLAAHGQTNTVISALWSIAVLAELVAFLGGGRLESRLGLKRILGWALALTPLRWGLLALGPSLPVLIAAQVGHAATFALVHLAGVQLVQREVPVGNVRHAQALYSGLSFGLGIVTGTALAGPLYQGLGGSQTFAVAAGLSGALFLLWIPLSRRVRS